MVELITDILAWLDDNPWLIDALFAAIVAIATVATGRFTARLVRTETDPDIAVYLEVDRRSGYLIDMVIRNVGRGPAYNVQFSVDPDFVMTQEPEPSPLLSELPLFQRGLPYMAPGQHIRFLLGAYGTLPKHPVTVTVSYAAKEKTRRQLGAPFVIEVGLFHGMSMYDQQPEREVVRSIRDLEQAIKQFRDGDGSLRVNVSRRRRRGWVVGDDPFLTRWPAYPHERLWYWLRRRIRKLTGRRQVEFPASQL